MLKSNLFNLEFKMERENPPLRVISPDDQLTHYFCPPMKLMQFVLILPLLITSCNNNTKNNGDRTSDRNEYNGVHFPPGSVVAADSVRIPDPLNELFFTVKLLSNEHSQNGTYDVIAAYGHNDAETQITFPPGSSNPIKPAIKKGDDATSFVIGFYETGDTTFHEYFLVQSTKGHTSMKYIRSYSFQ